MLAHAPSTSMRVHGALLSASQTTLGRMGAAGTYLCAPGAVARACARHRERGESSVSTGTARSTARA